MLSLVRGTREETELAREIDSHLRLLEDKFLADGLSAEEARYAARRAFGGVEQTKEHQRDARTFRWLAGWPMDLKLGARMLVKSPGLTAVAVLALSIAIGGGVAYLELITDHFHPSLPVPQGDRVVGVLNWDVSAARTSARALHDFAAWRGTVRSIEHLGAAVGVARNLITEDGRSEPLRGVEISTSAFRIIPTPALIGRPLVPDDERPDAPPVVLIGYRLWQSRFGGDPNVVGRQVRLGTTGHTIVGVTPEDFGFPVNNSLWIPLKADAVRYGRGEGPEILMFGKLAPDASLKSAQDELSALAIGAAAASPGANQHLRPLVKPYVASLSDSGEDVWILYSINAFFLFLLALCGTNVATLVFARTATREGEITVRTALGASRGRIVSQLFAEALVLSAIAAITGVALAAIGIGVLNAYLESQGTQRPFWWNESLSVTSLLYAAALALLAAAMIGIVPALKATGAEMQVRLKYAAGGGSGVKFGRVWTGLIVGQVAITVIFLLSVVSLAWSATGGHRARFATDFPVLQYLTGQLDLDRGTAADAGTAAAEAAYRARFLARYHAIERRFEADGEIAGVTYAARPPGLANDEFWVELDGLEPATRPASGPLWIRTTGVAADLFDTFDADIVRGRTFTGDEIAAERDVAIVDETFVRLILGGRDPLGLRVRHRQSDERPQGPWLTIVGVTRDLTSTAEKTTESAVLYRPIAPGGATPVQLIVRIKGDAAGASDRVRSLAASAGADVRIENLRPLSQVYSDEDGPLRVIARILAVVAALALLLATAGVYSLMSFTLARRTREIGIRAALGATPRRIITGIFSRAFTQIGLGVAAGSVPGAALVAFGAPEVARGGGAAVALTATAAVAGLIAVIALFACVVPARRALRIQPTDALRADA